MAVGVCLEVDGAGGRGDRCGFPGGGPDLHARGPDEALIANVRWSAGQRHPRCTAQKLGPRQPSRRRFPQGACPLFRAVATPTRESVARPSDPAAARAYRCGA